MPSAPTPSLQTVRQELQTSWAERELNSPRLLRAVTAAQTALAGQPPSEKPVRHLSGWMHLGSAYGCLLRADFSKAVEETALAAGEMTGVGDEFGAAWAGVIQSTGLFYLCRYPEGLAQAEAALALFEQLGDQRGQSGAFTAIANICRVNGQPTRALRSARLSLEHAQACGHAPSEATVLNNLGTIAHSLGDFAQSVTYFERSLNLARRISHRRIEVSALNNIGATCEAAGDIASALQWHRQSLALKEGGSDRRSLAISLNNVGIALRKLGHAAEAVENQKRSLALFLEVGDLWGQAYCHQEFSTLAAARGDFAEARSQAERTLELRHAMGDRLLEAEAVIAFSNLLLQHPATPADSGRARDLATAALAIGQEAGATRIQLEARKALHAATKAAGDLPTALEHCEAIMALEQQMLSEEADQKLKNLRVLHEVETAQQQLETEQRRSQELQAALDQTEQHRQRAIQADQYKSEVLRIVAHDLRSPVAAIRSITELLSHQHTGDPNTQELTAMLSRSAESVLDMVNNILDAAALEEGRLSPSLRSLDLGPLLQETIRLHDAPIRAKHQRLECKLESPLTCTGDAQMIATAVSNLLSNASKFSPAGSCVRLQARRQSDPKAGEVVWISVQDEGPGLTAEDQTRLFGRFTRLSARPTAGESSSGLGLFIVQKMVAMQGGRVWAESAGAGRGATFFINLPAG